MLPFRYFGLFLDMFLGSSQIASIFVVDLFFIVVVVVVVAFAVVDISTFVMLTVRLNAIIYINGSVC